MKFLKPLFIIFAAMCISCISKNSTTEVTESSTKPVGYQCDTLRTAKGRNVEIYFIKHGSLILNVDGRNVYIDPVTMFGDDFSNQPKADLAGFTLAYIKMKNSPVWNILAYPGRMALTNYVSQSVYGIVIFYGIGVGFGASLGLTATAAVAVSVFIGETIFSSLWLHFFAYGPLEWLWRMWNYKRYLPLRQTPA